MISFKNITKFKSYISGETSLVSFSGFSTDTRKYSSGDVFIAITGVNYNAFEYVDQVIKSGCTNIVFTHSQENQKLEHDYKQTYPNVSFITVDDSVSFLQELAKDHRQRLKSEGNNLKVVSISGSNGKTTCKEMLRHLCRQYNVVATQKNDNNHLGVPLTLLRMNEQTQFAIIELGSNHPGEIPFLCEVTNPDYAYATNIGYTHMEFFPTLNDVFKEESFPLKDCQKAFINKDDKFLSQLSLDHSINIGIEAGSFECDHKKLKISGFEVKNPNLVGQHNYHNLGAMIHIAVELMGDSSLGVIVDNAQNFKPGLMRSEWREVKQKKVFLDAYNANPSSMALAAEAFLYHLDSQNIDHSKAILVIGDMMELGSNAQKLHCETAKRISSMSDIKAIFIGEYAADYQGSWGNNAEVFSSVDEFLENSNNCFDQYSYIFLKASRSLQFERILDTI